MEPLPFKPSEFPDILSGIIYETNCSNSLIRIKLKDNAKFPKNQSNQFTQLTPFIAKVATKSTCDKNCDLVVLVKETKENHLSNFIGDLFSRNLKEVRLQIRKETHMISYVKTSELKKFHKHADIKIQLETNEKIKDTLEKNIKIGHKHYEYMDKLVRMCLKIAYKKFPDNKVNIFSLFTTASINENTTETFEKSLERFDIYDILGTGNNGNRRNRLYNNHKPRK